MNTILIFTMTLFAMTNAQWYIIKKDYPSNLMNYPNPGKRSLSNSFDCSRPYSSLRTVQDKTAWLFLCKDQASPLITIDDITTSSSLENELYPSHRLISHERRTLRSPPPYFFEQRPLFRSRLHHKIKKNGFTRS